MIPREWFHTEAEIINVIRSRRHRGIVYKFTKALGYSFSKTLPSIMFHVRKPTVIRFPKKISIELDVIVSPRSNRVSFILHVDENNGTTAYLLFTLLAFVLSWIACVFTFSSSIPAGFSCRISCFDGNKAIIVNKLFLKTIK